jgi:non-reducing end alpha-L-arabinofuranosidase
MAATRGGPKGHMKQFASNFRWALGLAAVAAACDGTEPPNPGASGGSPVVGGAPPASGGVTSTTGGRATGGKASGGTSTGGAATGGNATGGGSVTGPCDIYQSGNTPCVAAHSTVRALYGAYSGNLYQVKNSAGSTKDIPVLAPGGFANSSVQDTFCSGTTCTISIIYDQSGRGNHLTPAPGGGAVATADKPVVATRSSLIVGGHKVYAAYFEGGMGYRNNATSGIAKADEPESMYMVTSGTHYNSLCCFDYGNAETTNNDDGNGTMEAIYFGNQHTYWGWGNVTPNPDSSIGPWVEADLENGLFAGQAFGEATANTAVPYPYVTAIVKGKPGGFAIKAGNATSGTLKTMYEGNRPTYSGYNPMKKQGAIILGIGGDNSNGSQGTFYEGCMTTGYATNATDDAVQANIIAAGYGR